VGTFSFGGDFIERLQRIEVFGVEQVLVIMRSGAVKRLANEDAIYLDPASWALYDEASTHFFGKPL
jgi:hypothetical protein